MPLTATLDALRRSFWLPSAIGMFTGLSLGVLMPIVDGEFSIDVPVVGFEDAGAARSMLEVIATVSMSVAGISFSVTVVALQLASQQLSPRVLRTFQSDPLSKTVLGLFLGVFGYCLAALAQLEGPGGGPPEVTLTLAIALAILAFGFFVAFIHGIVNMLQASVLIDRIAEDGRRAVARRFPDDVGDEPEDVEQARRAAEERMSRGAPREVRAQRAGYLSGVDTGLVAAARDASALVRQRVPIGDFVLTGQPIADLWADGGADALADRMAGMFSITRERNVVQDVGFPIRQLADIALRGVSPGLNDPTTAENAMGSLTDTLALHARQGDAVPLRVDGDGEVRFIASAPRLDDLVRLGFEQVREHASGYPVLSARLVELLGQIRQVARAAGGESEEAGRQIALIGDAGRR